MRRQSRAYPFDLAGARIVGGIGPSRARRGHVGADGDIGPGLGKRGGDGEAHAGKTAGDDGPAAREIGHRTGSPQSNHKASPPTVISEAATNLSKAWQPAWSRL